MSKHRYVVHIEAIEDTWGVSLQAPAANVTAAIKKACEIKLPARIEQDQNIELSDFGARPKVVMVTLRTKKGEFDVWNCPWY